MPSREEVFYDREDGKYKFRTITTFDTVTAVSIEKAQVGAEEFADPRCSTCGRPFLATS